MDDLELSGHGGDPVCARCGSGHPPFCLTDWGRDRLCPPCFRAYEADELRPVSASIPSGYVVVFGLEAETTLATLAEGLSGHLERRLGRRDDDPHPPDVERAWIDGRLARLFELQRLSKEAAAAGADLSVTGTRGVLITTLEGTFETLCAQASAEIADADSAAELTDVHGSLDAAAFFASARDHVARTEGGA
jgi:hypothetical protein